MKYNVYCLKDEKVQFFANLVCDVDDENAIRNFSLSIAKFPITFGRPADYSLYRIGFFDTDTGKLVTSDHVFLINGESARQQGIEILRKAELEAKKEREFIDKLHSMCEQCNDKEAESDDRDMETETSRT